MLKSLVVLGALALAACGPNVSADTSAIVGCRAFSATRDALTVLKPQMSADQIAQVNDARGIVNPICAGVFAGEPVDGDLLNILRDQLRAMLLLEQKVVP